MKIIVGLFVAVFLFTINSVNVYAGGPMRSSAFIFCQSKDKDLDLENLLSTQETIQKLADELGTPFVVHSFVMGTYGFGNRALVKEELDEVWEIDEVDRNCYEDIKPVADLIQRKVKSWANKHDGEYFQGSRLIITPYSEEAEQFIRSADFYVDDYKYLHFEVEEGWIFAFSTDNYLIAKNLLPIILTVPLLLLVFLILRRKSKRGSKTKQ